MCNHDTVLLTDYDHEVFIEKSSGSIELNTTINYQKNMNKIVISFKVEIVIILFQFI